jgi:hypothetical protein
LCLSVYACVRVYVCVCMYVYVRVYVCVWGGGELLFTATQIHKYPQGQTTMTT